MVLRLTCFGRDIQLMDSFNLPKLCFDEKNKSFKMCVWVINITTGVHVSLDAHVLNFDMALKLWHFLGILFIYLFVVTSVTLSLWFAGFPPRLISCWVRWNQEPVCTGRDCCSPSSDCSGQSCSRSRAWGTRLHRWLEVAPTILWYMRWVQMGFSSQLSGGLFL